MKKSILTVSIMLAANIGTVGANQGGAKEVSPESQAVEQGYDMNNPNSLYGIITQNQEMESEKNQKLRLENERDIITLQTEILSAQRELDKLTGAYQDPQPKFDVQKLREDLFLELQAQIALKQEMASPDSGGELITENAAIDGITTVKIEEIIQTSNKDLEAEVTTVGQSVRLVTDQIIYGWRVKKINFDSITFEKNGVTKKLYVPI